MTTSPHVFTCPDTDEEKLARVLVRVGADHHRFRTGLNCFPLQDKQDTGP
ncbi:hypothetical protein ACIRS3_07620 [Streptomyces virginiae]